MEVIKSKDNCTIKEIKKLKDKKSRLEHNKFLVEGFRFVSEALESSFEVTDVFISESQLQKWNDFIMDGKLQIDTKVYLVKDSILNSICSTNTPQGIIAVVKNKKLNIEDRNGFYILADKVQDPGNMGTIIRTADAAGALGIITSAGTVDIYNEKTLRSTMGSIFKIPIIEDKDFNIIYELKNKGFKLIVSSLDSRQNYFSIDLRGKMIIAVGNEGSGVSSEVKALSDINVKIPMPGNAESLNVAIAAGVMMFEAVRQITAVD